jgi:NADH-quinone oxidoreductase subunit J
MSVILFYIFATVIVLSAVMVVAARNPVHAILVLILAFLNASGIFLLVGAEFLALILAIVYVGAVAVLFLFVVMMLDVNFASLRRVMVKNLPLGIVVGLILLAELGLLATALQAAPTLDNAPPMREGLTNTQALGNVLYTDYMLAFFGSGVILLVAMTGAIVLTLRTREGVRRQDIAGQIARRAQDTLEIRKVKSGEGIS